MITKIQTYINEQNSKSIWNILSNNDINVDDLKKYLINGNPNTKNNNKQTPLIYCLKYNKVSAAEILIPYSNLNIQDDNGQSALFITLQKRRFSLFKKILETGKVDLEKIVNGDENYLTHAITVSSRVYISALLKHGAIPTFVNLYDLLKLGFTNIIEIAIKNISSTEIMKIDDEGNTLLHITDNVFLISKLLQNGVNPFILNNDGDDFLQNLNDENQLALLNRLSNKTDEYSIGIFDILNRKFLKNKYKI